MSFIETALEILTNEGVLLVPTDTHFAVAANPNSLKAMEKLSYLKDSLGISDITFCFSKISQIWPWVDYNLWQKKKIESLGKLFWPGPLKISIKARQSSLKFIHGRDIISVLCVNNSLVNSIITAQNSPLAVIPAFSDGESNTLVNLSSARKSFGDKVDLVVPSNNKCFCSQATTHILILDQTIEIIRQGDIDVKDYL